MDWQNIGLAKVLYQGKNTVKFFSSVCDKEEEDSAMFESRMI
jgi:hypothetical protein